MNNSLIKSRIKSLDAELKRIVEVLTRQYKPERIILFGSLASGKVHEWSDIDLAIIKKTKKRFIERLHEVSLLTLPILGVNFVVYTPAEFQNMVKLKQYFAMEEILAKGKVLYG